VTSDDPISPVAADAQAARAAATAYAAISLVVREVDGDAGERNVTGVAQRTADSVASGASVPANALTAEAAVAAVAAEAAVAALTAVSGPRKASDPAGAAVRLVGTECAGGSRVPLVPGPNDEDPSCGVEHSTPAACAAEVGTSAVSALRTARNAAIAGAVARASQASRGIPANSAGPALAAVGLVAQDNDCDGTDE
jgi:hypothetical protein